MTKHQKVGAVVFGILFMFAWALSGQADEEAYQQLHPQNHYQLLGE